MMDMVWLMKAIEAVREGRENRLSKDGVSVYKPNADVDVRIDIRVRNDK